MHELYEKEVAAAVTAEAGRVEATGEAFGKEYGQKDGEGQQE